MYKAPGGTTEPGSPLLIADLAKQLRARSPGLILKCLNIENYSPHFRSLQEALAAYGPDIVEKNYSGAFSDALPEILGRIGKRPAFFFIDPFGAKGIAYISLLPIFKRMATTEVFITLHTDGIAKKAGYFPSADDPDHDRYELARQLTQILADALNIQWKRLRTW